MKPENIYENRIKDLRPASFFKNWAAVLALLCSLLFFSAARPDTFLTLSNGMTILRSVSITTVLALAMTISLAIGGFDLSAGAMASFAGYFFMSFLLWYGMPFFPAVLLTLVLTLLLSSLTMFLIIKCRIPDLLATCAMQFVLQGLGLHYTGGGAVSAGMARPDGRPPVSGIPEIVKRIGGNPWSLILIMVVSIILTHVFLQNTRYGRTIYAIGSNRQAARLSGIPVKKYRFLVGMLSGVFIAAAGIMVACRNSSAQIGGADGYQFPALAAVFIGRSFMGAEKPNALGTFAGAMLLGVLDNGLIMMGVPYYDLPAMKGAALALALAGAYFMRREEE